MKIYPLTLLILAILLVAPFPAFPSSLVNVPLDHWSYHFIERLQAKGMLGEYLSSSKPFQRGEMAEMIAQTSRLLENEKICLTDVEVELLGEMKKEFAQELAGLGIPGIQEYRRLLDWTDGERMLVADIGFAQDGSFNTDKLNEGGTYHSTMKVWLYGDLLRNLSFYNYSKASYEIGKEPPVWKRNDPRYIFRYPWSALSDAYIVFGNSWISIQAGKDTVLWGPGYHGVIGLAGIEPAFDIIKFRTKIWKLKFSSLLGFLRDDLTKEYRSDVPRKYVSAHRVEIIPVSGIKVAWQEAFIYADSLHIELLNPLMPYQMAEDYLGDIGNNTMEVDVEISLIPSAKLYASLFLDDFHPDENPLKYPRFGWGLLGGILIADPLGVDNTDVILEYARVEPWAYTHKGTIQEPPIPTAFKHFEEPLGHWIGPNADDLFAQIGWRISKNVHGNVSYNKIRHGERGGNIYDAYRDMIDEKEKRFLGGIIETERNIELELRYTAFHRFEMSVSYRYKKTTNKQKDEVHLPRYDGRRQAWEAGWDTAEHALGFALQFTY